MMNSNGRCFCRACTASRSIDTRADDHGAKGEGQAEKQVQGDCAAHHLGQVGGGGDEFGLQPEGAAPERLEPLAEDLRQALAR